MTTDFFKSGASSQDPEEMGTYQYVKYLAGEVYNLMPSLWYSPESSGPNEL